jgi:6-phosphogluconolactonase
METLTFDDSSALAAGFSAWTADRLGAALRERGSALLIVSGGSTPVRFFEALSSAVLDWSRVVITLADERRVPEDNPRSNAKLLREHLLKNAAAAARFVPLADARVSPGQELLSAAARIAALPAPADVVVLGMGDDGHTASWFPGADKLAQAIDPDSRALVLPIKAPGVPEPRLTLTAHVLLKARAIALHIEGPAKRATLAKAMDVGPIAEMPIRAALRGASDRLTIVSTG